MSDELQQYGGLATIPAGKTIQLQMNTVCLNYGRPDPQPSFTYQLVSLEQYSNDPVLAELLESYTERVDRDVMQASAWHVANDMTWERLTALTQRRIVGGFVKIFTSHDIEQARKFVDVVELAAKDRPVPIKNSTVSTNGEINRPQAAK